MPGKQGMSFKWKALTKHKHNVMVFHCCFILHLVNRETKSFLYITFGNKCVLSKNNKNKYLHTLSVSMEIEMKTKKLNSHGIIFKMLLIKYIDWLQNKL